MGRLKRKKRRRKENRERGKEVGKKKKKKGRKKGSWEEKKRKKEKKSRKKGKKGKREKRRENFRPPLKANPLPAKLTHLPSSLPRKSKNGPPPYSLTQRKDTVPYNLFPPTLLRPLVERLGIPLLSQPTFKTPPPPHVASLPTHPLPPPTLSSHTPVPVEAGRRPSNPPEPLRPSCLPCRGPGPAHPMQLPSVKKMTAGRSCLPFTLTLPGRSCLPPFLYATLYASNALAYPGSHPTRCECTCPKLLGQNLWPTRSLLPRRRSVGRSCLPYLSQPPRPARPAPACTASVDTSPAYITATEPSTGLLPSTVNPLCPAPISPPGFTRAHTPGRHGRRTRDADQVPFPISAYPALSLRQGAFALSGSGNQVSGGPPSKCPLVRRTLPLGNLGEGGLTLSRS